MHDYLRQDLEAGMVPAGTRRWFNHDEQAWVVQLLDAEGNQIGEATYVGKFGGGKAIAQQIERNLREQYGI